MSDSLTNAAVGKIIIDTSQAEQAPAKMGQVAQGINGAFKEMTSAVNGLGAAFGIAFGAQSIRQFADAAIRATEVATAYNRQMVAARGLAGSQQQLNDLIVAYQDASGGAVDRVSALASVTRLLATGMAHNADDLTRLVTAVRGASIAMGRSQDEIVQEVQLAISNQSTKRLDQIGLGVQEVEDRINSLRAANQGMTREAAFQAAVLETLQQKYGGLAGSTAGAKTGLEKAGSAAKDFGETFGEFVGPTVSLVGDDVARTFHTWESRLQVLIQLSTLLGGAFRSIGQAVGLVGPAAAAPVPSWMTHATGSAMPSNAGDIASARAEWGKGILDLNQRTNEELLRQNQDYEEQRASSEREFQQSTLRSEQDFSLQRQREEQDMADSLSRMHRDSAEREERMGEDLARSIADANTNSAERIADAKKDANGRLAELDENYEKERVKRAKDLSDKLLDAAGNLDAKQVYELQRNAAKQEEEAKESHDDQREKLQKQLDERIEDERKSLAKSIRQQQETYDRQIEQGRRADAEREADMQADFAKRREQEDIDYGIRMARMAEDHRRQLAENAQQQALRIQQIQTHAAQEREQLDEENQKKLLEVGLQNAEWLAAEQKRNDDARKLLSQTLDMERMKLLFPNNPYVTPPTPSMGNFVTPSSLGGVGNSYSTNNSSFAPTVNVNIAGGSNLTQKDIDDAVHDALIRVYRETR